MFGVGWEEMLVIGLVALVVIGPKDLPVVLNRIGKVMGTIRRMGNEFQREINRTTGLDQITDLRRTITEPLRQTAEEITRQFNQTTPAGGVSPTGVIQPASPDGESVVDEIHARVGMGSPGDTAGMGSTSTSEPVSATASLGPLMTSLPSSASAPVESPAPPEAVAPKRSRAPRRKAEPNLGDKSGSASPSILNGAAPRSLEAGSSEITGASSFDASSAAPKKAIRRRVTPAAVPATSPAEGHGPTLFPVDAAAIPPSPIDATPVTTPAARARKPRTPKPTLES